MREIFLYIGPLIGLAGMAPYIVDIFRGTTKPNVVSWATWTLLTGIGTAAVIVEESLVSALLPLASTISTLTVVLLGLKFGFAKYSRFDSVCQFAAVIGLVLWWVFNSPLGGLVAALTIDAVAVVPTLLHSWKTPREETWQTFAWATLAAAVTGLGIESYTLGNIAYPIYLFFANGLIAAVIIYRRRSSKSV